MNTRRWLSFGTKPTSPSLLEIDELYRKAIAPLNEDVRLDYCKRLLCRTEYYLKNGREEEDVNQLKKLAQAASEEITQLNGR